VNPSTVAWAAWADRTTPRAAPAAGSIQREHTRVRARIFRTHPLFPTNPPIGADPQFLDELLGSLTEVSERSPDESLDKSS
jgi:hypothetical protein